MFLNCRGTNRLYQHMPSLERKKKKKKNICRNTKCVPSGFLNACQSKKYTIQQKRQKFIHHRILQPREPPYRDET